MSADAVPVAKAAKGAKGKGKGAKPPPRMLYYGPEEMPNYRGLVPISMLTRRNRTRQDAEVYWSTKQESAPLFDYDVILDFEKRPQPLPMPQTTQEREAGFASHWAFRPKPTFAPLREAARDMRPFVERMLEQIAERQRRERMEAEAERQRQKAAKKKGGGKRGKKK
jgi:hypothetical protein